MYQIIHSESPFYVRWRIISFIGNCRELSEIKSEYSQYFVNSHEMAHHDFTRTSSLRLLHDLEWEREFSRQKKNLHAKQTQWKRNIYIVNKGLYNQ